MPQKYRKLTRIKKNTDKFYSNSSFSSESVIQWRISFISNPQSKTHQFIVQFVLILRMHALALYRQQIIQYGKIFILVDFIQVTVKYTLGNFLQLKRLPYLYLPPFGEAVLIMNEGTAKTFLINIFLLFQTVDYAVYGIIGNTPTRQCSAVEQ